MNKGANQGVIANATRVRKQIIRNVVSVGMPTDQFRHLSLQSQVRAA